MRLRHQPLNSPPFLVVILLALSFLACSLPGFSSDETSVNVETAVASTLTSIANTEIALSPSNSPTSDQGGTTTTPDMASTEAPTTTVTSTPPPDGLSFECDGTYQREQVIDLVEGGKAIIVESWADGKWNEVWRHEEPDPMMSQIEEEAGHYLFGECQYLVALPIRYTGSGANLALGIYRWNGTTMEEVYFHEGVHGDWSKLGNTITFQESIYLYGEANCCPCNRQYLEHTWNGTEFSQTGSLIEPTYQGDPPDYCQP